MLSYVKNKAPIRVGSLVDTKQGAALILWQTFLDDLSYFFYNKGDYKWFT